MLKITVKAARVNAGMAAKDVAKLLELSINAYSRKENGHVRFYLDEVIKLSRLFNVPIENFFEAGCHEKTRNDVLAPVER